MVYATGVVVVLVVVVVTVMVVTVGLGCGANFLNIIIFEFFDWIPPSLSRLTGFTVIRAMRASRTQIEGGFFASLRPLARAWFGLRPHVISPSMAIL